MRNLPRNARRRLPSSSPSLAPPTLQATEPPLTPLHLAAFAGRPAPLEALLSHPSLASLDPAARAAFPGTDPLLAQPHPLALAGLSGARDAFSLLARFFDGAPAAEAERPELYFTSAREEAPADAAGAPAEAPTDLWEAILAE